MHKTDRDKAIDKAQLQLDSLINEKSKYTEEDYQILYKFYQKVIESK